MTTDTHSTGNDIAQPVNRPQMVAPDRSPEPFKVLANTRLNDFDNTGQNDDEHHYLRGYN